MVYTEIQKRGNKKYYYRTVSKRNGSNVSKERVFMGTDLKKNELAQAEVQADRKLGVLESLLTVEDIEILESIKDRYASEPDITRDNRYEAFTTEFTYDSTAIEGNTLTLQEAGMLLFEDITPKGKSVREINEVIGHKKAFDYILEYDDDISRKFINQLHSMVMKDTVSEELNEQIGKYRTVRVFIRGVDWTPPGPDDVKEDMASLLTWYSKNKSKLHPLITAIYFHVGFEIVHPYIDGNGRVGRLLMNFILHRNGFPMVNIPNSEKNQYYQALGEAQVKGDLRPFIDMMIALMDKSDIVF